MNRKNYDERVWLPNYETQKQYAILAKKMSNASGKPFGELRQTDNESVPVSNTNGGERGVPVKVDEPLMGLKRIPSVTTCLSSFELEKEDLLNHLSFLYPFVLMGLFCLYLLYP